MTLFWARIFVWAMACLTVAWAGGTQAKPLNILTDIGPVQALVRDIAGAVETPVQLITKAVSPHEFALKPSDVRAIQRADVIIWTGPTALPGLAKVMATPDIAAKSLRLDRVAGSLSLPLRRAGVNSDSTHNATSIDPHGWLAPDNARLWITAIVGRLILADPENAATYRKNAARLDDGIVAATAEITAKLASVNDKPFVQYHDAFQYFEHSFGMTALGFATVGDHEAASLGLMADLRAALATAPSACVFVQTSAQQKRALPLLQGTTARLGLVSALNTGAASYPEFLKAIAAGYFACLSGK